MKSRANFEIKNSVKDPLITKVNTEKVTEFNDRVVYFLFRILRTFYTSLYFYFFPLYICVIPLVKLLLLK